MKNVLIVLIAIIANPAIAQNLWTINYPKDEFTDDALLDLRYLNENVAGQNGFIQLSEDGEGFVHIHPGIHGGNSLDPAQHDWRNPVAAISITRID